MKELTFTKEESQLHFSINGIDYVIDNINGSNDDITIMYDNNGNIYVMAVNDILEYAGLTEYFYDSLETNLTDTRQDVVFFQEEYQIEDYSPKCNDCTEYECNFFESCTDCQFNYLSQWIQ
jgi:hypothetical protein